MEIIDIKRELPMGEFLEKYVDVERFLKSCSECRGYGMTWACPPYDFDPNDIWRRFRSILIYGRKVVFSPEEREKTYDKHELTLSYNSILKPVKQGLMEELYALEAANEGSLALSAGGCDLCAECTRPKGGPCRFPDRMRYSVESIGGDVLGVMSEVLGEKVLWAEDGRLPEHFLIVGGLLRDRQSDGFRSGI